jgi:hypothetical protein
MKPGHASGARCRTHRRRADSRSRSRPAARLRPATCGKHNQAAPVPSRGGVDSAVVAESARCREHVGGCEMLVGARMRVLLPRRFATLGRRRRSAPYSAERQLAWSWRTRSPLLTCESPVWLFGVRRERSRPLAGAGGLVRIHVASVVGRWAWWRSAVAASVVVADRLCARGGRRGPRRGAARVGSAA